MRFTGTLKTWDEERGSGLIAPAGGGQDIMVQRKALPRDGQWPVIGETLSFEIEPGPDGQKRAARVLRQSQPRPAPLRQAKPAPAAAPPSRWHSKSVLLLVVAGLGLFGYDEFERQRLPGRAAPAAAPATPSGSFRCDGRSRCSQMSSCAEAKLVLQQCPGVELDEDGDGIPCEQQWCH